ncbi:sphingomyelin phosphodiesterase [Hypoxylon fragiforme]|uniref:sphingomyelin phosphodiesterase n=1 Tax=Hypoxylon fragiforme TaxID=63214 RepID=UPI0020C7420C|nr:sphingomyelin phosphodiesterase [Hypoxylon fragiforme]KAI2608545.1 sphingomyelin phosphodiesterase [Hypoxylon fragiforme]
MWRLLPSLIASVAIGQNIVAAYEVFDHGSQKVLIPETPRTSSGGLDFEAIAAGNRQDAQSPASCATCEGILLQLKLVAWKGDDFFINVATKLCKLSGVEDDDVCEGSIALEGPIIANGLRHMSLGSRTSQLACVAFMGLCPYPEVTAYNVTFPSPKPEPVRPAPSDGLEPLYVVHFSDIHVDPLYVVGATANCSKPICCREYTTPSPPAETPIVSPARFYGEHTCDTPVSLEESMYAAINSLVPSSFAIFTGDIVDHAVWATTTAQNKFDIEDAYARMARAGLHVYGTAGNHEASPANSFPPTAPEGGKKGDGGDVSDENSAQWLYDVLSSTWTQWIGAAAAATTREFGAYSVRHEFPTSNDTSKTGTLRIISLSTNLYYAHNYWLYEEPMQTDPSGQLAWLVEELDAAERAGERVYIIGHMALGSRDAFHDGSNYFDQIVVRYEGVIAGMFFGHTHFDEFELSYSDYSSRSHRTALATSYIAPSLVPTSGHPAFRVYTVDPVTFGVLDATTYIANMSDPASFRGPGGPKWTKYYSAKEVYGPLVANLEKEEEGGGGVWDEKQELTPAFWHRVTDALERNVTAFNEYFARRRRGWAHPSSKERCDDDQCRGAEICKLRAARAQDNCIPPGLRLDFVEESRRKKGGKEENCGGSVLRDVLGVLARDADMLALFEDVVVLDGGLPGYKDV